MSTVSEELLDASLAEVDPAVAEAIGGELNRQRNTLEMIASENFVPRAVLEAAGSVMTNKYAEGYPGRRYYGGCEQVDIVEQLAIDRAMDLFGAGHANVQPHSGAQANNAAFKALLKVMPDSAVDEMHRRTAAGQFDTGPDLKDFPRPSQPRDEAEHLGQALQGCSLPRVR